MQFIAGFALEIDLHRSLCKRNCFACCCMFYVAVPSVMLNGVAYSRDASDAELDRLCFFLCSKTQFDDLSCIH